MIADQLYFWTVKADYDYNEGRILTVFDEAGKCFLRRNYMPNTEFEHGLTNDFINHVPVITPSLVRVEILKEEELNREWVRLDQLEYRREPINWHRDLVLSDEGVIISIGLDLKQDILVFVRQLEINLYRRIVIKLGNQQPIWDDYVSSEVIDQKNSTYLPFGPLEQEIPCSTWHHFSGTVQNVAGDHLLCYPCYPQFVYFQPAGECCLEPDNRLGCIRMNRIHHYNKYGFSASGNYVVMAEMKTLIIWSRERSEHLP